MTKVREIYRCQICGNVVEVVNPGAVLMLWRADEADEGEHQRWRQREARACDRTY